MGRSCSGGGGGALSASFCAVKQAPGGPAACLMSSFVMRKPSWAQRTIFLFLRVNYSKGARCTSCTSRYNCCSSRAVRMSDGGDKCHIRSGHSWYFKLAMVNRGFAHLLRKKVIKPLVSAHIRPMKDGSLAPRAHQGETPG